MAATWPNLKEVQSLPERSVMHEQSCCLSVYYIVVVINVNTWSLFCALEKNGHKSKEHK